MPTIAFVCNSEELVSEFEFVVLVRCDVEGGDVNGCSDGCRVGSIDGG